MPQFPFCITLLNTKSLLLHQSKNGVELYGGGRNGSRTGPFFDYPRHVFCLIDIEVMEFILNSSEIVVLESVQLGRP